VGSGHYRLCFNPPVTTPAPNFRLLPMRARDPHEPGRVASSLELFFDLVFVVAVSNAAVQLHDELTDQHVGAGLASYALVFFAIWWAWMNFTWFATSFATDDWLYRIVTIGQMAGVLILSAGIEPLFADHDLRLVVFAYIVMRMAMVAQWLRASRRAGPLRRTALTYAVGIAVVQALWLVPLALSGPTATVFVIVLILAELTVPILAERGATTPSHPHHITERYGLFTLIVLGETLLAAANAIIEAVHDHEAVAPLAGLSLFTLIVTAALWWIYFRPPHHRAIPTLAASFRYGYVHYLVFAAAGALSAGVEVLIDVDTHHSELGARAAAFTVTVPIAVFLLSIWWIAIRAGADQLVNTALPIGSVLVLLSPLVPYALAVTAVLMALMVAALVVSGAQQDLPDPAGPGVRVAGGADVLE
jgi:low temperature requirement protein LtrA